MNQINKNGKHPFHANIIEVRKHKGSYRGNIGSREKKSFKKNKQKESGSVRTG